MANISSSELPHEKIIELVNQLYEISKSESIPTDQLSNYINQKLEQKKEIEERIQEVDNVLQVRWDSDTACIGVRVLLI
jgi:hypothetical protein